MSDTNTAANVTGETTAHGTIPACRADLLALLCIFEGLPAEYRAFSVSLLAFLSTVEESDLPRVFAAIPAIINSGEVEAMTAALAEYRANYENGLPLESVC